MDGKERASLILALLLLVSSLLLLSTLSNVLSWNTYSSDSEKKQDEGEPEQPTSAVVFKVSPVTPQLYWSVSTADYYTGFIWLKTTNDHVLLKDPEFQNVNATSVFTVELNTNQREFLLPIASPNSEIADLSVEPHEDLVIRLDTVGNVLTARRTGKADKEVKLGFKVSWNESEPEDGLISLSGIQRAFLETYLQLPEISTETRKLAEELKDASYSVLDQVLADVQFLKTDFVYDLERLRSVYENPNQGSDVSLYLAKKKGICTDAATTLAVILRIQGIPARISFGYKPGATENGQLLYYKNGGHAVTEVFLPPYGWVQFDATPPLEEQPLVKASSFKEYCSIGDSVYYQLSVTNRRSSMIDFRIFARDKLKWSVEVAPIRLWVDAFQTADAFLKVAVPDYANKGEKDLVTLTVASLSQPEIAASILTITQVGNVSRIHTTTFLRNHDETVVRGEALQVDGDIVATDNGQVENMTAFVFATRGTLAEGALVGKGYSQNGVYRVACRLPPFLEVGGYKLVVVSLGTAEYAPSSADSLFKLCATTEIVFLSPNDEFLIGFGAIHGRLAFDNGTGLAGGVVSFKVTASAGQSEALEFQNRTNAQGLFRIVTGFGDPGAYVLEVKYAGSEYVLGSSATRMLQLKTGRPSIQISSEKAAIRGGFFNVTGTLRYESMGIWGERLNVTLDEELMTVAESDSNGDFELSLPVDSDEKLGSHTLIVSLEEGGVSAVHEFAVKSRTTSIMRVSDVAGGMFYLLFASLSDDHGMPVSEARVTFDGYALSGETDINGNLAFLVDNVKLSPSNMTISVRFDGSDLYLPAKSEETVFLAPMVSMSYLIPLFAPIVASTILACAKYVVRSRRLVLPTRDAEFDAAIATARASQGELLRAPRIKILLPDVDAQFPKLWGVNEKLRIQAVISDHVLGQIDRDEVTVSINNDMIASGIRFEEGVAEVLCFLTAKGEHTIRATLKSSSGGEPSTAEIIIRAVDYGEEIVRLYSEFLKKMVGNGINARKEMTGREIEALVSETGVRDNHALHKVTECFEKAEYSEFSACRRDYETMYTSLKELGLEID